MNLTKKNKHHRDWAVRLRKLAMTELGLQPTEFTVRSNKGGVAVLGEIVLHTDKLYLQVCAGLYDITQVDVMYRSCEGRKDYRGGQNQWSTAAKLAAPDPSLLAELRRIQDR